jgi:hypothetical protein
MIKRRDKKRENEPDRRKNNEGKEFIYERTPL